MSFDATSPDTGQIARFDSREAFERHAAIVARADRSVSMRSGPYSVRIWYLREEQIIGCWTVGGYSPPRFHEQPIEDMAKELALLEAATQQREEQPDVENRPSSRNANSKIDLNFRPTTYWSHPERKRANIKGTLRRRTVAEREARGEDNLEPELLEESIDEPARRALQGIDPWLRSGEDLPDSSRGEIEIARLTYTRTVHCEVTSIRARRKGGRIHYRVVDEYATEIWCGIESSDAPLTLGELIDLIEKSSAGESREGLYFGDLDWRVGNGEATPEDLEDFIEVSSTFYPEIERWYEEAFREWLGEHVDEDDDPEEDDDAEA